MTDAVQSALCESHRETLQATVALGRHVADSWETDRVRSSRPITEPFRRGMVASGLDKRLIRLLVDAVSASGGQLGGQPVAAPPYLVAASRGPICRATMRDGRRLVVELQLFGVERNPRSYVFLNPSPEECLQVEVKR